MKKKNLKAIKAFGDNLKQIRESKGMTQKEVGYNCEMEESAISRIERGVVNTSIGNVFAIAEALKVRPIDLFDY